MSASTRSHRQAFLTRALGIPAALAGGLLVLTASLGVQPAPTATASTTKTVTVAQAEQSITTQVARLTAGLHCYPDPTGHTPATAIVKADGGFTAYTVTAHTARRAATAGTHWVLAWCDTPKDTP